ncbi:MAG: SRPBCC domain-containing protein [Phycisphaerales bacterium]|nr:SRPBCC domain-containing protein [Phycisphaerales bacterium]
MSNTERHVSRITIRASIQDVWKELTKTDDVQKAMFNMRLHTDRQEVGGQVRMRSPDGKWTGVVGEITVWEPPHRYAHTFRFTNFEDPPCTVLYELEEVEGGVQFTLTADGIPAGTKTAKQMKSGSDMICKSLKSILETGRLPFGTRLLYTLFKLMAPMTPKKCRTEHWPLAT